MKDYIVIIKDKKLIAIEDNHDGKMVDGAIIGHVLARTEAEAINYIKEVAR